MCYKENIQSAQYSFPYHYIPHFSESHVPSLCRVMSWGFDYLCYQKHISDKALSLSPSSVLDVGCGDGYFIGNLPSSIPIRVGIDKSSQAIAFARAFHPDCTFYNQDAEFIVGKFDIVTAIEVIEHIREVDLYSFFNTLYDRLNDNGRVIISVPTNVVPLNKKHYRHYTKELLCGQLRQSGVSLQVLETDYVFSKPWWYGIVTRLLSNRLFILEMKPLMRYAWRDIWCNHRIADEKTGFHLVAVLKKGNEKRL